MSAQARKPPSSHRLVYTQFWPAALKCLAIGSIVYYSLELTYTKLQHRFEIQDKEAEIKRLDQRLQQTMVESSIQSRNVKSASERAKKWWIF